MKSPDRRTSRDAPRALGGVIHTYQKYDPRAIPSPNQPPPDVVSSAFDHLLAYGDLRELTDEELARAVHLDPSMIAGLGPSIESLRQILLERKRKILETYETDVARQAARKQYRDAGSRVQPPKALRKEFDRALNEEQLRDLERLWYKAGGERSSAAGAIVQTVARLADIYQLDELAAKYAFTGRTRMTVPQALEIKEELETIDRLLKQLDEAEKNAQIGVIDVQALGEFVDAKDIEQLSAIEQQIQDIIRELAERQGLERTKGGYRLTPKAYRLFQGKLLEHIFSELQPSRSGRHQGPILGEGAVELQQTKPYEFGDSIMQMDIVGSMTNAMLRAGASLPVRMKPEDIEIHKTRNNPKCATVVLMDMSGSMRYGGLYIGVKRMGLALDGLIRREYPGDFLQFLQVYTFAKPVAPGDIAKLLPKPVTIFDSRVQLKADMSRSDASEHRIPPHFTNLQHGLHLARKFLSTQSTPNRQIILITDGLPTAHFEGEMLYMLYPPHPKTESATLREGQLCQREGITINVFLLPSWSQSHEDVKFAYRLAEGTKGRVFFTAGRDLDRYVVWDYVSRRRSLIA